MILILNSALDRKDLTAWSCVLNFAYMLPLSVHLYGHRQEKYGLGLQLNIQAAKQRTRGLTPRRRAPPTKGIAGGWTWHKELLQGSDGTVC